MSFSDRCDIREEAQRRSWANIYNGGPWSFWHDDIYEAWWDPLAPWHNDRTNLGYADGHGAKLVWKDERTVWFAHDRFDTRLATTPGNTPTKHEAAEQPNNPDQQYMSRAFPISAN